MLAKLGGFDLAGLCGVFLGGALEGVPVVMDGFISGVAALCAVRLCPAAAKAVFASHCSSEPAARLVLDALGKAPLLTAGLHLGEGTGAVASIPLWDMALAVYGGCYSFAEGGIEPGTISADDFISPQRRALAQKLLDGLTPAAILEEMDDEEERSRTAKLLSSESGAGEQELRMVADYLRVLEKKRKENEIKALKEKMSTQQGEEKRGTLIKIQELLAQENKTGRRE